MKTITLIRHGFSEGNANREIYKTVPDYAIRLTKDGYLQSIKRGAELAKLKGRFAIYSSPYWRARDTYQGIVEGGNLKSRIDFRYEDSRLREQEWGNRTDIEQVEKERDSQGHYYYRFQNGESCADVEDRMSSFLNTLTRDLQKPNIADNIVIITHGMTMRVFLKRYFHLSIEEFELLKNPPNCSTYELYGYLHNDAYKYKLITENIHHEKTKNNFIYEPFKL